MSSINIWDEKAGLQSCWFDCESFPTAAYNYPSNDEDFTYLTGYRDDQTRAEWYDNVLFFSCLEGCRSQLRAERWLYIMVPIISAFSLFILLVCCCVCKGCPLAKWYKESRSKSAKIQPRPTPPPNPFLVSSIADFDTGYGYNSLGFASNNAYKRRQTLDRKMQNMEATMMSLAALPRAPPAALYNPLEHGRSLNQGETLSYPTSKSSGSRSRKSSRNSKSSRIKVARVN